MDSVTEKPWNGRLLLVGLLLVLLCLAWSNRFVQDDAFISFRYADNLVRGQGLVWEAGDKIEGYTNFLWTLLMTIPLASGHDPVLFSQLLGLLCFLGTLLCTYCLACRLLNSEDLALVVLALLGTNYTFSAYATGGLETQLQAFLVSAILLLTYRIDEQENLSRSDLLLLSLSYSAALMTRLDSAIFVLISGVCLLWKLFRAAGPLSEKTRNLGVLALPSLLIVGGWFLWKISYYGNILPNTFYAKADSGVVSSIQGLKYLQLFLTSYGLVFLLILPILYRKRLRQAFHSRFALLAVMLAFWSLYLVKVGGDFMEFRFLVPVLPAFFLLLTWFLFRVVDPPLVAMAALIWVVAGSYLHSQTFSYDPLHGIESIQDLADHIESPDQDWDEIGRRLRSYFGDSSSVKIATTAAGAIPYYSGLPTLDMLGLNDPWIARHGLFLGDRPGHQRTATFDYLRSQRANLIIGHPRLLPRGTPGLESYGFRDLSLFRIYDGPTHGLPEKLKVIEIPIHAASCLRVLYLTPHPDVDQAIRKHALRTFPLDDSPERGLTLLSLQKGKLP